MRPYKLSLAASENRPARPAQNTGELLGNFDQIAKDTWPIFLGSSAFQMLLIWSKFVQGPITFFWTIGAIIGAIIGGYGAIASGFTVMGKPLFGSSKANYAYPNFYPYGNPNYYFHLHNPYANRHPNAYGYVNIPRISNALAAKEQPIINTASYQLTPRNVIEDTNHVFSYIMDVY